jgi:hypothetical protein
MFISITLSVAAILSVVALAYILTQNQEIPCYHKRGRMYYECAQCSKEYQNGARFMIAITILISSLAVLGWFWVPGT